MEFFFVFDFFEYWNGFFFKFIALFEMFFYVLKFLSYSGRRRDVLLVLYSNDARIIIPRKLHIDDRNVTINSMKNRKKPLHARYH